MLSHLRVCGDPTDPETVFRPCSIFNSAASRAAVKLKYKPKIVDGNAVRVDDVPHKFTFILEEDLMFKKALRNIFAIVVLGFSLQ